jgi:hypothetical protein
MRLLLASRDREMAVALPALYLASCLPTADISSYSTGLRGDTSSGVAGGVSAGPGATEPGTGSEATPTDIGLVQSPLGDAGLDEESGGGTGLARPDAGIVSPCGAERSLGPNGNCFLVEARLLSWQDARDSCRAQGEGWDLASIRAASESAFAAELATAEAWVGATDTQTEGRWTWARDGAAFWSGDGTGNALDGAYANWNSNEPNGGAESDCARVLPRTPMFPNRNAPWADVECSQLKAALCEGPLDAL